MSSRWQLTEPNGVRIRYFNDEAVIFHLASGSLHLVTRQLADSLALLGGAGVQIDRISETLQADPSIPNTLPSIECYDEAFSALAKFGIVEFSGDDMDSAAP